MMDLKFNKYQSSLEELNISQYPEEVQEQFYDFVNNVPYIRNLVSPNRRTSKDMPRDDSGKIIIDLENPHIIEDMDYFRPTAIHFQKTGRITDLRPNANPNSEFGKWIREEIRRCWYGYVRESDGEWVSGDMYYYLNYCPIQQIEGDAIRVRRVIDMPQMWEGQYLITHYLNKARESGMFAAELASRGRGKSYLGAALLAKRFNLGEDEIVNQKVQSVVTASLEKYIHGANQILDMFKYYIDFTAEYTEFPRRRLTDSFQSLTWESGYKDTSTGLRKGSQNAVIGITSNSDSSKLIGSRGVLYIIEEMGKFPGLRSMWDLIKPCVSDGKKVWGLIFAYGTAGEDESDFTSAKELLYNPLGYNIYAIKNVYDKQGLGRDKFAFFFPAYMNRAGCYNKDGVSDVTKALIEILMERYVKKYNSSDINSITTLIAQNPITPQEAIMKVKDNFFPVTQINERINQLDSDTSSFDDVYVGDFAIDKDGKVTFVSTQQQPIREFPLDEKTPNKEGAVELFELPQKVNGEVPSGRYIISVDPYDKDQADTTSLYSMFIFDLFTDRVVGEYTGRPTFAQTAYERTRLAALFYNARVGYENNIMGLFQYFTEKRCVHLLLETPEFLYDKQIIKIRGVGNAKYGIRATVPINNLGNDLIKQWLMQTTIVEREVDGQLQQIEIPNLYVLKNRAFLQECAFYNPVINVDRIRSFGILMIYRQSMIIIYGGDIKSQQEQYDKDDPANDDFFTKNYHPKNAYALKQWYQN